MKPTAGRKGRSASRPEKRYIERVNAASALWPVVCALTVASGSAWANAVDVSVDHNHVMVGRGMPTVKVVLQEPLSGFHLVLERDDGKKLNVRGAGRPGSTHSYRLDQGVGRFRWRGALAIDFPTGATGEMPLEFETEVVGPLTMTIDKARDVDVEHRTLTLRLSNPAAKVSLKVKMDTGDFAFDDDIEFHAEAPGTPLTVTWPAAPGKPLQISVVGYDTSGAYTGVDFFPWAIEIPHDEVVFDTGEARVRADQQPKIDASAKLIAETVAKFGRFAEVKLFVAGHTDSVGSSANNRALSLNRAAALTRAFRAKGLKIPMYFEGFGEEALAVETPDETDEPKNRRAQYFVAIHPPTVQNATFTPNWQRSSK